MDKPHNAILNQAQRIRNDEFYTQYADIQSEINAYLDFDPDVFRDKTVLLPCDDPEWSNFTKFFAQNFELFGLKKLISTSYAVESKQYKKGYQPTLFETRSPLFDSDKTRTNGKIFTLTRGEAERTDINALKWDYLDGDGDFRSPEVTALRDEADIIVTNPPFSLFREFLAWIVEGKKTFSIIGNINALTYREVFPLITSNKIWLGPSISSGDREFIIPEGIVDFERFTGIIRQNEKGENVYFQKVVGVRWFTNIEHGKRHQPLSLMTMADNVKFSKHKEIKGVGYRKYDNYDALEVTFTDAIPSDYDGVMGVPISFLDKYNPEQFEIIGATESEGKGFSNGLWHKESKTAQPLIDNNRIYKRIFIRHKGK